MSRGGMSYHRHSLLLLVCCSATRCVGRLALHYVNKADLEFLDIGQSSCLRLPEYTLHSALHPCTATPSLSINSVIIINHHNAHGMLGILS